MKKVIISLSIVVSALFMVSCGGNSAEETASNLKGTWKIDMESVDLTLGDAFPEDIKAMVEGQMNMVTSDKAKEEAEEISLVFNEDGTFTLSKEGEDETPEGKWSVEGDKLVLSMDESGKEYTAKLDISECSTEKLTVMITAESLIEQVEAQEPDALNSIPPAYADQMDAFVDGTSLSISFDKM